MKHEADYDTKPNEILAEHTIEKQINGLLSEYKNGNDVYGHSKE